MAENITSTTAWALVDAIKSVSQTPSKTTGATTATVTDIDDDGTVWILIPGAEDKTPVNGRILAAVTPGDVVQIEINSGQLSILGNTTTPAVGQSQVDSSIAPVSQMAGQALVVVNELQANKADIVELNAAKAHIDELEANKASIDDLTATNAIISQLAASKADISDLNAANANIANLEATKANISDLTATNAHIDQLEANKADINLANVNNAWIDHGLVRDAAITDAKIAGVSANKLTAGTIDANEINVTNLRADNLKVTRINGQPVIGGYTLVDLSNSTGVNPSEAGWYELVNGAYILSEDTTVQSTKAYYTTADSVGLYDRDTIDSMVNGLNSRIDAQIETWTSNDTPTLNNYPASDWTTDTLKQNHIGDICYVNNTTSESAGFIYRFAYDNAEHVYKWLLIRDTNITDALGRISDLETFESTTNSWMQDTDDGLRTIRQNYTSLSGRVSSAEESFSTFEQTTFRTLVDETDEQRSELIRLGEITDSLNLSELSWEQGGILDECVNADYISNKENSAIKIRTVTTFSLSSGIHTVHMAALYTRVDSPTGNPSSQNWYIIDDNKYVLTSDTEVVENTVYYTKTTPWRVLLAYFTISGVFLNKTSWMSDGASHEAPVNTAYCAAILSKVSEDEIIPSDIVTAKFHISPYSVTLLNTTNRLQQTADSNSAVISSVTTLLGTNPDGTTREGDVLHRINSAETRITQNTSAISLSATKNEVQQIRPAYAFCSTLASTAEKVATIDPAVTGYSLYKGAVIAVVFSDTNTAAIPTLNVNSTGAKEIRNYIGTPLSEAEYGWSAGATIVFVYDGTYWRFQDNGTVNRISSAEASILINSSNINLKVSKNGIISSINQSAETIKINAGKVEIGGFTVTNTALYSGANVQSPLTNSVALTTVDFIRPINGINRGKLRLALGSKFGVDSSGNLFANGADITDINANNITGGTINANLIKTGIIRDTEGKNEWDLRPGYGLLKTTNMTAVDATLLGNLNMSTICQTSSPAIIPHLVFQNNKVKKIKKVSCRVGSLRISSTSTGLSGSIDFIAAETKEKFLNGQHRVVFGSIGSSTTYKLNVYVPKNKTVSGKELKTVIDMPSMQIDGLLRINSPRISMNGEAAFNGKIRINNISYKNNKTQSTGSCVLVFRNGLLVSVSSKSKNLVTITKEPVDMWYYGDMLYIR